MSRPTPVRVALARIAGELTVERYTRVERAEQPVDTPEKQAARRDVLAEAVRAHRAGRRP